MALILAFIVEQEDALTVEPLMEVEENVDDDDENLVHVHEVVAEWEASTWKFDGRGATPEAAIKALAEAIKKGA